MKIRFSQPDISDVEIQEVISVLRSGWITTGPETKKFEKKIAEWIGVPKAVCLSSCTACEEIVLRMLGVGLGDEVIVPAYTYTATASAVCHVGARPVLVDSQEDNLQMDYQFLEDSISEKTKAIVPVDLGGIPCDYDRIFNIVENKRYLFHAVNDMQEKIGRVAIIADAAHAFGAEWHGENVGRIADFTDFSFHAVKNLTTGEGGAFTWRHIDGVEDNEIYKKAMLLSMHGQSKDAIEKTDSGSWEYDIIGPWYKCNMTDINAALGLAQIERYPGMLKRRKEIIARYDEAFRPLGIETSDHFTEEYSSSGHLYMTRIPGIGERERNSIISGLAERGIECNVHYKPLPMFTAYKDMGFDIKDYPNAFKQYANEVTLPLYSTLTDEEVEYVIKNYREVVKKACKGEILK